jgi:hypothetical protein
MRLLSIRWPEQWTSPWHEVIHIRMGTWGLPPLPVHLRVEIGDETVMVTAVARDRAGRLICEVWE